MAYNINDFRDSLLKEVANPTNYEVKILSEPTLIANNSRYQNFVRDIVYRCETCSLPSKSIKSAARQVYGPIRKVAYGAEYQDVSFSFIVTDDFIEKEYFEFWQNSIVNNNENSVSANDVSYYDDYVGKISIEYFDKSGKKTYRVILEEAYPIMVQETPLSWNSNNDFIRMTVTMAYKSYIEESFT